jgi:uncharacterized protein involved in type VI secretion and phage assembly
LTGANDGGMERLVADLVQRIERSFFGKYRGLVVDNADPQKLGRLKVRVPSVLGQDIVTGWAMPCVPFGGADNQGMLMIPDVDAGVWVEFEEGDLEFPIWVGTYWSKPSGTTELPKPNGEDGAEAGEAQDPPTKKTIKTSAGHTIQLEDKDGEESILVVEGKKGHFVLLNKDGITVQDAAGNALVMSTSAVTLTAKADLTIDASGQAVVITGKTIDFKKG